ncbi:hypothetical protein OQX61_20930 [Pedobacter sp. PLR]|uniref:TlpA family protein disulfide reductase n=1 Tax=Pedobacter sp. PLR TaxID=2994465 RepID=UPI002245963B|nr:hypothetical protein [Pedobacter sp. PLR]MCX2453748.1 hypothetical protein [Pedobacter sp. PLR]
MLAIIQWPKLSNSAMLPNIISKDILFISLAINDKKELQRFLSKTKFDYATVPGQEAYMRDQLNVEAYPTHFLINKEGKLVYSSEEVEQIARRLEKEIAFSNGLK